MDAEIEANGPITFLRFTELALYESGVGYYAHAAAGPGPQGDYITSPELHSAFGALLCSQLEEMWRRLGAPSEFWLVEGGPGRGLLAADVLQTAEAAFPRFATALRVALIERSGPLRATQEQQLAASLPRVQWIDPSPDAWHPLGPGCVFANELLDAFPVHRVIMGEDGLQEAYVASQGTAGPFLETAGEPSGPEIAGQIDAGGGRLEPGHRAEVNLAAPAWVRAAAALLERGYGLFIDYGEPASRLYGRQHPNGTLRCYWRHTMNRDPFSRVGTQDITAHVDLSAVTRGAEFGEFALIGATRQATFLGRLGFESVLEWTGTLPGRVEARAHRAALSLMVAPRGLGRLAVLAFGKHAPDTPLSGLAASTPLELPMAGISWDLRELAPRHLMAAREA